VITPEARGPDQFYEGSGPGAGTLTGGHLGPLQFARTSTSWGPTPRIPSLDAIDITAKNISTASISVLRAHVDCKVLLHITTDGPLTVTLPGCGRVVHATGTPAGLTLPGGLLPPTLPVARRAAQRPR
jgi:hypothetical protein